MSSLPALRGTFARPSVLIYSEASIAEDINVLKPEQLLAYYLYLWKKLACINDQTLAVSFSDINFVYERYDSNQSESYDIIEPYLFLYLTTVIPRTVSDSFEKYQGNKVKGLVRQCDNLGISILEDNYILDAKEVHYIKDFMDSHQHLFAECFASFLSVAEEVNKNKAGYSYAVELKPSVRYVNMVGVMMIEHILIDPSHLVLTHNTLAAALKVYQAFKSKLVDIYGDNWVYGAVLARSTWNSFKNTTQFRFLWITSGLLCDGTEYQNYRQVTVGGNNILSYANYEPYRSIVQYNRSLTQAGPLVTSSNLHGSDTVNQLRNQFSSWASGDGDSVATSRVSRYSS